MEQEQNTSPKEETFPSVSTTEKSNLSMFVGVGAFIIVLTGLGWYAMQGMNQGNIGTLPPANPIVETIPPVTIATTTEDSATTALSTQGTSDDAADINADLKATNLDSLGDITNL